MSGKKKEQAQEDALTLDQLAELLGAGEIERVPTEKIPEGVVVRGVWRQIVIETNGDAIRVVKADVAGNVELAAILRMLLDNLSMTPI